MIVDAVTSSITTITDASGTNATRSTSSFTLPSNSFIVLPIANYFYNHISGDAVYTINGGSEVSFGAPILNQGASNDKIAFFVTRVVTGGTCIVSLKNCQYDMCPPIVLTGKSTFKVSFAAEKSPSSIAESPPASGDYPVESNGLEPTFNTAIPASVTPVSSSKIAIAVMTHGPDSGTPTITAGGTWTVRAQVDDYDSAHQPGLVAYQQISDNDPVIFDVIVNQSFRYTVGVIIIEDTPEIYMVMGAGSENPTEIEGWFGHDGKGGEDSIARVTFDPPVPAGEVVIPITVYGANPTTSLVSDDGGNTWSLVKQEAYNSESGDGNGGSVSLFRATITSLMSVFTYDATGLAGGANGRYGQLGAYVFENPDTVNGFETLIPVSDAQQVVSSVSPGSLPPLTNLTFWIFLGANRGHTENLKPYVKPSGYTIAKLIHSEIDEDGGESAVHDSITQSGWWFGKLTEDYTTEAPVFEFTGGTTFEVRSLLMGFNILGGSPSGGGGGLVLGVFKSKVFSSLVFRR